MTALLVALLLSQEAPALPEGLTPPTAQCPGAAEYPSSERATGVGGKVVINVTLDAAGQVTKTEVAQSLGQAFDDSALASAKQCTFTGAVLNGTPMPSVVQLTADFVPPLQPWTLEGDVVGVLGEPLAGAEVVFGGKRTLTDAQGHFSLTFENLPAGDSWVQVHLQGRADKAYPEVFKAGTTTRVRYLLPEEKVYETRIEGSRLLPAIPEPDKTPQVSKFTVTKADLDRAVGATEDVMRVVQQAPGVAADPDLLGTLFVRGGGPDEVVFYLDGVPLSNPYHLGGYLSIFNPMMLETAEFYTGGVPARYEPGLSGAMEVHYATGETKKPRVLADVSMLTAMARADVPLGIEGLSAVVSFRRSYLEAYFAILRAVKIIGSNFFAPEITEALARVNYRRGRHNTMLTYMFAQDGLKLQVSPGEQVTFNFVGDLSLLNRLHLASLQHKIDLGGDSNLTFQASYTHDASATRTAETLPGETMPEPSRVFSNDAQRGDLVLRADGVAAGGTNRLQAGVQYSHRTLHLSGDVPDLTAVPTWAALPSADTHDRPLVINPDVVRDLVAAYAEHTWRPLESFTIEAGGRAQLEALRRYVPQGGPSSSTWLGSGSARLAAAWTSPIRTVLKVSTGVAMQPVQSPLLLDPTYGNPRLSPERSLQVVGGIEQPLPIEALLKLEVWAKYLDQLVVNPDTPAGLAERLARGEPAFVNQGTGFARGGDLLFIGRTRHFFYGLSMGLLASDRTNPLAAVRQTYPTPWDQKFTATATLSWSPTDHWLVSGKFSFRTGRPFTPIENFRLVDRDANGDLLTRPYYVPEFGGVNSDRYPLFYELSIRAEYRFNLGPLKMAVYAEVMNLTNSTNVFSYIYGLGDPKNGVLPDRGVVNHLPIRPFLGLRAEY
ncbi:MAG: TonB-dependent receptor [Archangiaceae bacterium]|nr:TonB-dependent receptor [Archangiaceae bacterium]